MPSPQVQWPAADPAAFGPQRVRCLIVDDDPLCRRVAQAQAGSLGLDVRAVGRVDEALAQWQSWQPAILLIDCGLPDGDGYGLALQIRQREAGLAPAAPVAATLLIALSASAGPEHLRRCRAAGMDGVVAKPAPVAQLRAALAPVLAPVVVSTSEPAPSLPGAARTPTTAARPWSGVLPQLMRLYRDTCRDDFERLRRAACANDGAGVRRLAHRIRGASEVVGLAAIAGLAARLEMVGHQGREEALRLLDGMVAGLAELP